MGVIIALDEEIEQKLWAGMIKRSDQLRKARNKEKPLHYRDVNKIFGWVVFHARRTKMIEQYRRNDDVIQSYQVT